jgi:hypothetical protein
LSIFNPNGGKNPIFNGVMVLIASGVEKEGSVASIL